MTTPTPRPSAPTPSAAGAPTTTGDVSRALDAFARRVAQGQGYTGTPEWWAVHNLVAQEQARALAAGAGRGEVGHG